MFHRVPHQVDPRLHPPEGLESVVRRCLEKDPDRRYHNEMRLLEDLGDLAELAGLSRELGVPRETPEYLR